MRLFILCLLCVVTATAGCKKDSSGSIASDSTPSASGPANTNDLKAIGLAFVMYCDDKKGNPFQSPLPADLSSMEKYLKDADPAILGLVKAGKYKIYWSAPGSQQIVASEKEAETNGGLVCLRDGTVKKMTSAEIQKDIAKK